MEKNEIHHLFPEIEQWKVNKEMVFSQQLDTTDDEKIKPEQNKKVE